MQLEIIAELVEPLAGFRTDYPYRVFAERDGRFLLINDSGRFAWVDAERLAPVAIVRGDQKLFDRDEFRLKRRYEGYLGQQVLLTTWEDLGLPLTERNSEGLFVYEVVVEGFEGQLLMVRGGEGFTERSGVLASQISAIEVIPSQEAPVS